MMTVRQLEEAAAEAVEEEVVVVPIAEEGEAGGDPDMVDKRVIQL